MTFTTILHKTVRVFDKNSTNIFTVLTFYNENEMFILCELFLVY